MYLVDYSCYNAPKELRVDFHKSQEAAWNWKVIVLQNQSAISSCSFEVLS